MKKPNGSVYGPEDFSEIDKENGYCDSKILEEKLAWDWYKA